MKSVILKLYLIILETTIQRRTKMKFGFTPEAEILNARLAMLGFVAGAGAYLMTGQIIPGIL
jgi:hypothetical protein